MRLAGPHLSLFLAGWIGSPAFAQDPDEDRTLPSADAAEVLEPAPLPPVVPWAEAYEWQPLNFKRPARSVATNSYSQLVVLDRDGAVYQQERRGLWAAALGGDLSLDTDINEEDLLLDAEAAVEDFSSPTDEQGSLTLSDTDADDESLSQPLAQDIADAVDIGIQDARDRLTSIERVSETVWASERFPGLLLVSRRGAVYRTVDDGRTWSQIQGLPATYDFTMVSTTRLLVAATEQGLYLSDDRGVTWRQGDSALRDVPIVDLNSSGSILYAAGTEGLWQSLDGRRWSRLQPPQYTDLIYLSVAVDVDWTGGLWVATLEKGILRSDDAGQSFRPAGRNPLVGTSVLVTLYDAPGHLLAAGNDGVWETMDGGLTWLSISTGLPGPLINALHVEGAERPVVATSAGLYELRRPDQVESNVSGAVSGGLSVQDAVGIALRRSGISQEPFSVQRRFARARLTPRLRVGMDYQQDRLISSDYDAFRSIRLNSDSLRLTSELCFGACSVSSGIVSDADAGAIDGLELAVIGGEVYQANDAVAAVAPAAANVAQRLSKYRNDVAEYVTELYFTRLRLLTETEGMADLPLTDQVLHELELQEVVARLDIYTDGRYSSSIQVP